MNSTNQQLVEEIKNALAKDSLKEALDFFKGTSLDNEAAVLRARLQNLKNEKIVIGSEEYKEWNKLRYSIIQLAQQLIEPVEKGEEADEKREKVAEKKDPSHGSCPPLLLRSGEAIQKI